MNHFTIDGFNFGIDKEKSSVNVEDSKLSLEIVGKVEIVRETMQQEDHPWSWLIYPPSIRVIGLPCNVNKKCDFTVEITETDLDDYDITLYTIGHNDVLPCRITKKGSVVIVQGHVHGIKKSPLEFSIEFTFV